jgi:hypothetical protein
MKMILKGMKISKLGHSLVVEPHLGSKTLSLSLLFRNKYKKSSKDTSSPPTPFQFQNIMHLSTTAGQLQHMSAN